MERDEMHDKHLAAAGGLKGCSLSNHETIWADIADLVDIDHRRERDRRSGFGKHKRTNKKLTAHGKINGSTPTMGSTCLALAFFGLL
ncbi:hypothetical protein ACHAQJ_010330 [Trichoderma viride]